MPFFIQYFVLLARFPRRQLEAIVFSLSCSHKRLARIRHIYPRTIYLRQSYFENGDLYPSPF
ncbi:hypothetical protein BUY37_07600 [Staphylococcus cohnii]|uniref:Uncharacterized protein n=1 Tax=Staphylococcus cohnii TaxID=29382 RepID=A0A2T4LTG8_9STAP|nr:hypothetical protein [Staphylococcus cohnii]MSU30100.1 hypothetical protein [Staphylococcus sp. McC-251-APC-3A2]MBA1390756.1 hypothetical protein [Staphylococcus cohnii]PTF05601.1 hypothetical protein BUY36_08420 [Staphylococcus cohnii]PTF20779.1 hypothetical protein BUY40_05610 [Staphylococcus cohnii]